MNYFYKANGSLSENKIFENFDEDNMDKLFLKKHLIQMNKDTNKIDELLSRIESLESNFQLKVNDYKKYLPFTLNESKLQSYKEDNWKRDTTTNDYIYYVEIYYESQFEPVIFNQIFEKKKLNLNYKLSTEINKKNKKIRFNLELIDFKLSNFNNEKIYSSTEVFLKDTLTLNAIVIG